jgi:hypothetical protein
MWSAAPNDRAVEDFKRGEQGGRAVVCNRGHRPAFAGIEKQARLSAIERLDLRLLVD